MCGLLWTCWVIEMSLCVYPRRGRAAGTENTCERSGSGSGGSREDGRTSGSERRERQDTSKRCCRHDASVRHAGLQRLANGLQTQRRQAKDDAIPPEQLYTLARTHGRRRQFLSPAAAARRPRSVSQRRAAPRVARLSKLSLSNPSPGGQVNNCTPPAERSEPLLRKN